MPKVQRSWIEHVITWAVSKLTTSQPHPRLYTVDYTFTLDVDLLELNTVFCSFQSQI